MTVTSVPEPELAAELENLIDLAMRFAQRLDSRAEVQRAKGGESRPDKLLRELWLRDASHAFALVDCARKIEKYLRDARYLPEV